MAATVELLYDPWPCTTGWRVLIPIFSLTPFEHGLEPLFSLHTTYTSPSNIFVVGNRTERLVLSRSECSSSVYHSTTSVSTLSLLRTVS
jgi:hypothetical protein